MLEQASLRPAAAATHIRVALGAVTLLVGAFGALCWAETVAPTQRGVVIPIQGVIDDMTLKSLERRVDDARKAGASTVVFELDTPGGLVSSALDICNFIKNTTDLKTVAWVHPEAYSAGAMIAVACQEIVVSPVASIGDCAPIMVGPDGLKSVEATERAKIESPIVSEFRDSASRRGYDPLLSEAMVRLGRRVWWVDLESGQRKFVDDAEKARLLGDEKSGGLSSFVGGESQAGREWKLVENYVDAVTGKEHSARQPVVDERDLLTMNQSEAVAYGFAKAIVSNVDELSKHYEFEGSIAELDYTWSERLVGWLTSPVVRSILLMMVFLGAYAEFKMPGIGLAGLVAVIALGLFLGAPYLTGLANVWEVVVLLIGVGLLALELFVIPGFGIAGISGVALILISLVATFVPEEPGHTIPFTWPRLDGSLTALKTGVKVLSISLTGSLAGMVVLSRFLPKIPVLRNVVPANPTPTEVLPDDPYRGLARVGDVGRAETGLRPSGKARFGGLVVDVVAEGEFCDAGHEVEVIERRGNRVVVRPIDR